MIENHRGEKKSTENLPDKKEGAESESGTHTHTHTQTYTDTYTEKLKVNLQLAYSNPKQKMTNK